MNLIKSKFRNFILIGVFGMCWFYTLLYTAAKAYGLPVQKPQAKVQELIIAVRNDPQSLDPHKTVAVEDHKILQDLLEGPYIFDSQGNTIPGTFVYAYSNDQQGWTFNLRLGLRWSNGEPVTAYDFVYSWQRLADPQTASPKSGVLQEMGIKHINDIIAGKRPPTDLGLIASGPSTLHLFLDKPLGFITKLLTDTTLLPIHPATVKKYGDNWSLPAHYVSNGAYCLKERVVNDKVVLTRNPYYWNNKNTQINQVTYLPIADADAELAHYKNGLLDISSKMNSNRCNQLLPEFSKEIQWVTGTTLNGLILNTKIKPFNDVRVRQALNLALDREKLFESLAMIGQVPAYNVVPDGTGGLPAFQPPWRSWNFDQRLHIAKQLLQQAGCNEKNPLTFSILYPSSNQEFKQLATYLNSLWNMLLGARITLNPQEWKMFLEKRKKGEYQMARFIVSDYNEPYGLLSRCQSVNTSNQTGYANPQFDHFLEKTWNSMHDFERHPWYHRAEALLAEEAPIIPISHPRYAYLVKPYVGGLSSEKQFESFYTKNLYIRRHSQAPKSPRK
ncbi:MAG: peptide ABC transporter substrate-binding protein [Candidatus Symbiodolus clandestinus]